MCDFDYSYASVSDLVQVTESKNIVIISCVPLIMDALKNIQIIEHHIILKYNSTAMKSYWHQSVKSYSIRTI